MKTKNIVLLIGLLLYASSAAAQTRFYNATRTFHENGFTYQADVSPAGSVVLYNKAGGRFADLLKINLEHRFKDGRGIPEEPFISDAVSETFTPALARQVVRNAFSAVERSRLGPEEQLGVTMIICSDTGSIKEIHFRFGRESGYATIPVSTYRRLELELIRRFQFTPSAHGRSLNFMFRGWHTNASL
jgi:hypothetical protein